MYKCFKKTLTLKGHTSKELKAIFLKKRKTFSDSSNIFHNHNVLVATGDMGNEIIIQIKKW